MNLWILYFDFLTKIGGYIVLISRLRMIFLIKYREACHGIRWLPQQTTNYACALKYDLISTNRKAGLNLVRGMYKMAEEVKGINFLH